MNNIVQKDTTLTQTPTNPNHWRGPLLGMVGLALMLGIFLSPVGGFIASIMTLNSWVTIALLIWAAGSIFHVIAKIESQNKVAPNWAWAAFFSVSILFVLFVASRVGAHATINNLVTTERTVEKLVMAASPSDLERLRLAKGEAMPTLKALEGLRGAEDAQMSLSGKGMMVSDVSSITTYAFSLNEGSLIESYTYRPCKDIVSAYLALDGVIRSKNMLQVNGHKVQANANSPCQFNFNQITFQKL